MALDRLANIFWHTLTGDHSAHSIGNDRARRFAPGFPPMIGFPDPERPDFEALEPFCKVGESFFCDGWRGDPPPGWTIAFDGVMLKMAWLGPPPVDPPLPDGVRLGAAHVEAAMALADLTRPGPFGPHTLELGEYLGLFEGGRLLAMAGERLSALPLREISGVCTHPEARGRGLARRLMAELIRRESARGEISCLHVLRDNLPARRLYEDMGFATVAESPVRVLTRLGLGPQAA